MRIALIVAGVFVLAIGVVVATGALLPKQHVASRSARFHSSPERLFALISGPQSWRADVVRDEAVPDAAGRQLRRETTRNGQTVVYELLNARPPRFIERQIATKNLPYSGTWTFSLAPDGASTLVRITERGEVYNPVFRFVARFVLGYTSTMDAYLRAMGHAAGEHIVIGN